MIKTFLSRKGWTAAAALLLFTFVFSACKKNDDNIVQTPASGLMAFNLAPDQPAVNIALSGNLLAGAPLSYGSFTGTYLSVYSGSRRVDSYSGMTNQLLDSLTYPFQQDQYYSLFLVGSDGNYKNIVVKDNYDSLHAGAGKAYVRFVNAIPGSASSSVVLSSGGTNVVSTSAAFGEVSSFTAVTPGELAIHVSNENSVDASRTISVAENGAYTVLLAGLPNATDSSQAVKVRYIQNGTVTD